MSDFSELTEIDRQKVYGLLGLAPLSYILAEYGGPHWLRGRKVSPEKIEYLLEIPKDSEPDWPIVSVRSSEDGWICDPSGRSPTLWELIFPLPFARLGGLLEGAPSVSTTVSSTCFRDELVALNRSLCRIEDRLANTELAYFSIQRGSERLVLCCQFSGHNLLRVGKSRLATDLGERVASGEFQMADIAQRLGPSANFFALMLENEGDGAPLATLTRQIEDQLGQTGRDLTPSANTGLSL